MGASHITAVGHRLRRDPAESGDGTPQYAVGGNMYTVYIIKSEKLDKFYIGYTNDIADRICHHNSGANRSTCNGRPWKIVYQEQFFDKRLAWLRERQIKLYKGGEAFKKLINGCVA